MAGREQLEPNEALRRLMAGRDLTRRETQILFGRLMDGGISDPLKAAILVALAIKGEAVEELTGAVLAMRERLVPVPHRRRRVVDTCGTGGDGRGTFNISTAAAVVAAAAGVAVAKHGNRSVSSRCGSADVLAALGVAVDLDPEAAGRALDTLGITFLFAPRHHPAMREVMPVRRELGVRTIFNLLGPLTNPAGARRQLLGVYSDRLVKPMARVLASLGSVHALVVHGNDGLDEITTSGPTRLAEVRAGRVREYTLEPESLGVGRAPPLALAGGQPQENAARMRRVLSGEESALSDIATLNAAAAVYVGGLAESLEEGLARARQAVSSGAAVAKLAELVAFRG